MFNFKESAGKAPWFSILNMQLKITLIEKDFSCRVDPQKIHRRINNVVSFGRGWRRGGGGILGKMVHEEFKLFQRFRRASELFYLYCLANNVHPG